VDGLAKTVSKSFSVRASASTHIALSFSGTVRDFLDLAVAAGMVSGPQA
jgi:hypothetical protein